MALDNKNLLELMKAAAQATPTRNYSYNGQDMTSDALNATLRNELRELAGDYNSFRRNKIQLFELVEQTLDFIVPRKIEDMYASFAETKTFAQGDRPIFRVKGLGKLRAKQFITRVGLAGLYETFKLGETWFELNTSAVGGAAHIGFEEFLDGRVDFSELTQIVIDSMAELIQKEVGKALLAATNQLPANNYGIFAGFDEGTMDRLIAIASAYGNPTIYCTRQFAAEMIPSTNWISDAMKDTMWNTGYLGTYKGVGVVLLPQSVEDETNTRWAVDPGYAWIIPSDGNTKPVKIAFEGQMHMKNLDNYDWSQQIHFYQKVGVGAIMTNNICIYENTELAGKLDVVPAGE